MISIENLSKGFGKNTLFEDTGFRLNEKERIGLVGRNGHGKTTLFKMITGEEKPDEGSISIPKYYRIGYVTQHIDFKENTVLKEGMRGLDPDERDCRRWEVEKILMGLGFSETDMNRDPYEFSGGFQVRLNLVKILVSEPNMLLLDEPTNYLDITSIRWIESFLKDWRRELILITHDRGFMDKVTTHIVGIHRKKMRKIKGNTEKYYYRIAMEEEVYEKTRLNDERKRQEMELFINRFRAKARLGGLVQSRVKTIEKLEKREKLETIKQLEFSFRTKPVKCRYLMTVENLGFGYKEDEPLIKGLNFSLGQGEKICVVGKNGKGKTTLLKIFANMLNYGEGSIVYNPNVEIGFYEQTNVSVLNDERSVVEEILYSDEGMDLQTARNIAGAMMFEQDAALKRIGILSGGEKARVMLGKLLATSVNLLLLDEPTNHLDMDACDALLAALDNFDGAVIMVTHNEMFLNAISQKLIVFQDEEVFLFDGTYADFLEKVGWHDEDNKIKRIPDEGGKEEEVQKIGKKELRKMRSEILANKAKVIKPMEQKIAMLEEEIETTEKKAADLNDKIIEASREGDGARLTRLSREAGKCRSIIEDGFERYVELTGELEKVDAEFAKRLEELEGI